MNRQIITKKQIKIYLHFFTFSFILFLLSQSVSFSQLNFSTKKVLTPENESGRLQPVVSNLLIIRFKSQVNLPDIGDNYKGYKIVGRLLSPDNFKTDSKKDKPQKKVYDNALLKKAEDELLRSFIIEYSGNTSPEYQAAKIFNNCSEIEIAEPYYLYEPQGRFVPNDTLVTKQLLLETIQSLEAWDIFKGDTSVVIGISDTGVMQDHEDLFENIYKNHQEIPNNGIDDDLNGYIDDFAGVNFSYLDDSTNPGSTFNKEGHGTLTTGIASATTNNTTGLAGIGYNCRFFPMKAGINNTKYIYYGLQSIIYAGQNKIDVLNCSWGGPSYSCFAQSAVDFAVANDVAIVAAAGNHANYTPFYPAGYRGVLGVGVTDAMDTVIEMSATGAHVDLMAPGQGAITTNQLVANDTVTSIYHISCCTSAASPIVAGVVASVRAKYPELNALQALTHTRISNDDIRHINQSKAELISGRINHFKALTNNPFDKPGFEITDYKYLSLSGSEARFSANDTFRIRLNLKNLLGVGQNIKVSLKKVQDINNNIELIDSIFYIASIESNQNIILDNFLFKINNPGLDLMFFGLEFEGDNNFYDRLLIPIIPGSDYATFSNNILKLSVSDNGRIGFSDSPFNLRGEGFVYKNYCNTLFEGSFFATESQGRVISQARNQKGRRENDFLNGKPFLEPDSKFAIFWDGLASESDKIGLMIRSYVDLAHNDTPCVRFEFKLTNISGNPIEGLSAGYFFDWDLGADADSNVIRPFPESLADARTGKNSSAALIYRNGNFPYIALTVCSEETGALAQMISLKNDELFYDGIISDDQKRLFLNSGTDLFKETIGEISMVAGMKFPWVIPAHSSVSFSILICSEENLNQLTNLMRKFSETIITGIERHRVESNEINISYNYISGDIIIKNKNYSQIESLIIYDYLGNLQFKKEFMNIQTSNQIEIKTDILPSGLYFVAIKGINFHKVIPVLIFK